MNNVHHKQANKRIITTNIANSSEIFLSKKKKNIINKWDSPQQIWMIICLLNPWGVSYNVRINSTEITLGYWLLAITHMISRIFSYSFKTDHCMVVYPERL